MKPFSFNPERESMFVPLFEDAEIAAEFAAARYAAYMIEVEVALAQVQGTLGVIPAEAAAQIVVAAQAFSVDHAALLKGIDLSGVPTIDLVRQLRGHLEGGAYVHWGATTQDIMDTVLVLQVRAVLALLEAKLDAVIISLAALAREHRHTVMAGRTHAQQALPVTFGFKAAGWIAPLLRHRTRLAELKPRVLVVQFGGAVGTLAALGEHGVAVQRGLADALGLGVSVMPWHTQRDSVVEVANWLSMVSGSLAKMAQDVILLTQSEVGEVRESADPARGGSSTMPQKSNPVISEAIIAAARTNAALLSGIHQAAIQEHERGTHGWQMEWLTLPQMAKLTGSTLTKAWFLGENLVIDVDQMRYNLERSGGLMLAESLVFALAAHIGRAEAQRVVREAAAIVLNDTIAHRRHLADVLRERVAVPLDWDMLKDPARYLGAAEQFVEQVLIEVQQVEKKENQHG